MQALLLLRPVTAEVGFRRATVGTLAAMEGAANPVFIQIIACRNDLGLQREVTGPLHLAEIRRSPRAHQGLETPLPFGAHDLDLEIAAAGRSPGVVCRAAWGRGTRVCPVDDREGSWWRGQ